MVVLRKLKLLAMNYDLMSLSVQHVICTITEGRASVKTEVEDCSKPFSYHSGYKSKKVTRENEFSVFSLRPKTAFAEHVKFL